MKQPPLRLTPEIAIRIVADVLMVNAALLIALVARCLWLIGVESASLSAPSALRNCVNTYVGSCWLLTLISIAVFYFTGFYTHGRIYRERYKALVIAQAVSLSYLIFGYLVLVLWDVISFPRSALFLAWFLTLVFLICARLWARLWQVFAQAELTLLSPDSRQTEVRRVLVIGGAGYIGSMLVQRLLELGYGVRVLDILLYGDASVAEFFEHPDFQLVHGDFRNIHTVVRASKGMDAIVHLGAIVGDSACSIDQNLTREINLRATRTIAEIGKGFGVKRFIFASTCSVYGASDEILNERSTLRPLSLYARTKLESEDILLRLADTAFAPTILRFATVYGLSRRPRFDLVVNLLTAKAIEDGEVVIFGGKQWRPLVHVKDVAEAIVLTLQAPLHSIYAQIFNVGSNDQNFQISELGSLIQDMIPDARVVALPQEDARNYRVQFEKIHNMLGFQPRYTVRDGMREIMDAFAGGRVANYRDPCYNNFSYLKQSSELKCILFEGAEPPDWVRLSAAEAEKLAKVAVTAAESQSEELMTCLRKGLALAAAGNVGGFVNTLTTMEIATVLPPGFTSSSDRQSTLFEP